MANKGGLIGNDNLFVPDAPTIGTATAGDTSLSVTFTAPSDVGGDAITEFVASASDGTNVIGGTGTSSPVTITGLTNGTSYTASVAATNGYGTGPLSSSTSSVSPQQSIAFFMGGESSSARVNSIDKIVITSAANATDFGNLTSTLDRASAIGGATRCITAGGFTGSSYATAISFKLFSSSGNMTSFGSLVDGYTTYRGVGFGNTTRGIIAGGLDNGTAVNVMQFVTIASEGNSTDFGNLTGNNSSSSGCSNSTRGIDAGGNQAGTQNIIQFVTIASAGNATDFGDLTVNKGSMPGATASTTRALIGGGSIDVIDFITIASAGNATDFGNLSSQRTNLTAAGSTTRAVFGGGVNQSGSTGKTNIMEFVTIASLGNTTDFGDLSVVREAPCGASNAHGGLA